VRSIDHAFVLLFVLAINGCATSTAHLPVEPVQRSISSLDNDSATSIDAGLETAAPDEEAQFLKVATLIGKFVEKQKAILEEKAKDAKVRDSADGRHVYGDYSFSRDHTYATRDVHRKPSGCFSGQLKFRGDIVERLNAQTQEFREDRGCGTRTVKGTGACPELVHDISDLGVFVPNQSYDAVIRYSNGNPKNQDDRFPDARGMAVKILPVGSVQDPLESQNVQELNAGTVLDILGINFPTFFTSDAMKYLTVNEAFLKSAENFTPQPNQKILEGQSVFLSGFSVMERKLALSVNGSIIKNPLFQDYYSMVPSRLGKAGQVRAIKYQWSPVACRETAHGIETFQAMKKSEQPAWSLDRNFAEPQSLIAAQFVASPLSKEYPRDFLRTHAQATLKQTDFCYDLLVQLYRDQVSTNIETAEDFWAADQSEKKWWMKKVVPPLPVWLTASGDHHAYVERFNQKEITARIPIARLTIKRSAAKAAPVGNSKVCEDLSFSPWSGRIDMHKPLGVMSRLKRRAYNESRRTRHQLNGIDSSPTERKQ
jgi:hypothetical protein